MRQIPDLSIQQIGYRRIAAAVPELTLSLLKLRTIDDIFLNLGTWQGIVSQRTALTEIRMYSAHIDLLSALSVIAQIRQIPKRPGFSVTASFVGKRNYTTEEIKQAVMQGITSHYAWQYSEDEVKSDIDIRVFIEHQSAYLGLRLGKTSLQKRAYKQIHTLGSLKPPVAAAMLLLGSKTDGLVVDPFCGAGTILIEACLMGFPALGGDLDNKALDAAVKNAEFAGSKPALALWNAHHLPIASQSAGMVVSNLPWGKQVPTSPDLERLYQLACLEIKRILLPGSPAVILTSLPEWIPEEILHIVKKFEISLFGQNPTILIATG
jgi:23S rRNA G2445 N2-methylase RlmL